MLPRAAKNFQKGVKQMGSIIRRKSASQTCLAIRSVVFQRVDSEPGFSASSQRTSPDSKSLVQVKQGKQKTEIHFDPASRIVTIKLLVQDQSGNMTTESRESLRLFAEL
jgi:hypothetical protein